MPEKRLNFEALAKKLLDKIKRPEDEVVYRDLDDEMVFVSRAYWSGMKIDIKAKQNIMAKMLSYQIL